MGQFYIGSDTYGADKISINSQALADPTLISRLADRFGVQCIVVGIDTWFDAANWRYQVNQYTGDETRTRITPWQTLDWVDEVQRRGAGEIVLNMMNQDGVRNGYDLEQLRQVRERCHVPLIASGGAGAMAHFLAASVFHKQIINIAKKLNYGYTDFMSYSIDFRRRILSIKKHEGLSIHETAKRFHIGTTTIVRWTKQIDARPATSRQRKIDKSALERDVEQYPDAYQRERAERFGVCQMAICKALKKLQLTYKKTLRHPKVDEDARQAFQQKIQQYKNEGKAIVFIDESGFDHDTPRTHGYSLLGKRCYGLKDWGAIGIYTS